MVAGGQRCALLCLALAAGSAALGKRSPVKVLSDGMWQELLQGEWMVEFYAPWCPACQSLQPEWEKFAEWGEDLEVNVAKVDVTEQPGLSGRFIITALPTIYHCKDGEFRRYQGGRTKTDFINFISDQEWKSIEPVSSWFGPSSFLMSSMSALFQLSMWIRHCHGYLTESVGLPVWGSYAVFVLATLFSGLTLGLVMVFLADCICPSKRHRPPPYPYSRKLAPESAQLLKKLDEEQEADKEDISDDETEGKEVPSRNSSPSATPGLTRIPSANLPGLCLLLTYLLLPPPCPRQVTKFQNRLSVLGVPSCWNPASAWQTCALNGKSLDMKKGAGYKVDVVRSCTAGVRGERGPIWLSRSDAVNVRE